MDSRDLLQQIEFIKEIDKIKYIERRTKLINSNRRENDAEHSWHLALMVMVLAEHADKPLDILKVLKMVLIHDIVEIDAGDIFIFDTTKTHTNTAAERIAASRIFGLLPKRQATEFMAIWEEFEARETAESKFARSMDRLEPLLQNVSNKGGTWNEFDIEYKQVLEKQSVHQEISASIDKYAKELIEQSVHAGILRKD